MRAPGDQAKSIFLNALEIASPSERHAFVAAECGGDEALFREVEDLLAHQAGVGSFLEETALPLLSRADSSPLVEGTVIGPYKLLRQLGEGGMGTVWMAEQAQPVQRTVALKVIKPGMDSRQVVARFEAERQALALMDHPNIAKVLDAGATEGGQPLFVMELVMGVPITRYSDEHRLTVRQRLELFVQVCQAIQHAHQKGIIHRDIKPSNVLVVLYDSKPVPKVIDFGIAKATSEPGGLPPRLTERTMCTEVGAVIGTLEYMSPEQAELNNQDIDTRSDVYSLGVLLYELLTGTMPLERQRVRQAAILEVLRLIREEEPPRPSTRLSGTEELPAIAASRGVEPMKLTRVVRGELDWIVMKALEKDRNRRYETANGFAMDVQRYLADEPVLACPPSVGYRVGKFLRRHRGPVLAASLVLLALVSGIVGTTWGMLAASKAEAEARTESTEKARALESLELKERQARIDLALLRFDKGLESCERGEVGLGMQWLARSLETAPEDAGDLQRLIRMNLAAWRHQMHPLKAFLPHQHTVEDAAFSSDGRTIMTVPEIKRHFYRFPQVAPRYQGEIRNWDGSTGEPLSPAVLHEGDYVHGRPFSPDGQIVVTGREDGAAQLWDARSGQPVGPPLVQPHRIFFTRFSADGRTLLTASKDRPTADADKTVLTLENRDNLTLQLWEAATGKPAGKAALYPGTLLCVSPDLGTALVGQGKAAQLWNTVTGQPFGPPLVHADAQPAAGPAPPPRIAGAAFSPDGQTVLTWGNDRTARLWDVATGAPAGRPVKHEFEPAGGVFGPDGNTVVTFHHGYALLWGRNRNSRPLPTGALQAAFHPDGRALLTADGKGEVRLWDVVTGNPLAAPARLAFPVSSLQFSPDGRSFLTAPSPSAGRADTAARLWKVAASRLGVPLWSEDSAVRTFTDRLPSGFRNGDPRTLGFRLLPVESRLLSLNMISDQDVGLGSLGFTHDGKAVVTAILAGRDTNHHVFLQLQDAATGPPAGNLLHVPDGVEAVCTPDGRRVVTVAGKWGKETGTDGRVREILAGTIQAWEVGSWKPVGPARKYEGGVPRVLLSHDGKVALMTGYSTAIDWGELGSRASTRLWDAAAWEPLGPAWATDSEFLVPLALSRDGKLTLTQNGTVALGRRIASLRDSVTGRELARLPHQGDVAAAAFSPDGRTVVTGSEDRAARLWDVTTGLPRGSALHHEGPVVALAFSPDGAVLATWCGDGTARFWDTATAKPLGPPFSHKADREFQSGVGYAAFGPDGRTVVTGTTRGHLRCWLAPEPPLEGTPERLRLWAETISDRDLDDGGVAGWQTPEAWKERCERLKELGGPPVVAEDVVAWHRREAERGLREGNGHAAVWHLDRLIPAEPNQWRHHAARGSACAELGRPEDAIRDLSRAIELGADDPAVWYDRGRSRQKLGQDEQAIADYTTTIDRDPGYTAAWRDRGLLRMKLHRWAEAAADLSEVLKIRPKDWQLLSDRASCYANLKRHEDAIADLSQVVAAQPKNAPALFQRGRSYAALGRRDEAIADYRRVLQVQPDHAEAKLALEAMLKEPGERQP